MISYVILALFPVAAALNLIGTRKDGSRLFAATKPMLLSLLCLYCLSRTLPSPDLLLIAAFFACFIGDVLLMGRGDVFLAVGGVSFLAGHVLLIFIFARDLELWRLPLAALVPVAAAYAALSVLVTVRVRKEAPKVLLVPILLYLLTNAAMNVFALARFTDAPGVWRALAFCGAVLFFVSDCVLFLTRYEKERPRFYKTNFYVMLTYISGVLLIALGLAPLC